MSSYNPPYPYFNGITYNKSYFDSSGTGLSRAQANALYLQKTTPDTAFCASQYTLLPPRACIYPLFMS
jgi:hypothetical protein